MKFYIIPESEYENRDNKSDERDNMLAAIDSARELCTYLGERVIILRVEGYMTPRTGAEYSEEPE